jgi:hypothetical protein
LERELTDALVLGEKLLSLLEVSARTSTYKPALLLALIDTAQEQADDTDIPVRLLAERVIELYWPQTLAYPTTGRVLWQNQGRAQASVVSQILKFRAAHVTDSRSLSEVTRRDVVGPRRSCRGDARRVAHPALATTFPAVPLRLRLGLGGSRRMVTASV